MLSLASCPPRTFDSWGSWSEGRLGIIPDAVAGIVSAEDLRFLGFLERVEQGFIDGFRALRGRHGHLLKWERGNENRRRTWERNADEELRNG